MGYMGAKPNIIALTRMPPRRTASMIEEEMPFLVKPKPAFLLLVNVIPRSNRMSGLGCLCGLDGNADSSEAK